MATPTEGERRTVTTTPGMRTIVGWLAAIGIVIIAAFFVGRLGSPEAPGSGGSTASGPTSPTPLPIAFGTGRDEATGEVAADLRIESFAAGDPFFYSVRPPSAPGIAQVYVEVIRVEDGETAPVQTPAPQPLNSAYPEVITFRVPADDLIAAFGPGTFVMRIYLDPQQDPIAEGRFELVAPLASG
jgi:hypothetical protein